MILITKGYIGLVIPILIVVLFILFFYISPLLKRTLKQIRRDIRIKKLRNKGDKLLVKLADCKFFTNSFTNEKMKYGNSPVFKVLEQRFTEETLKIKTEETDCSIIYFEGNYNGEKKEFFSEVLYINPLSIPFIFERYRETYIYIDANEPDHYYFDFEFLTSSG